jgi:glutathione S-transferase/RNA polymerase-associated protein
LNKQIGTRSWFNGDQFGWGDICVAPFVNGAVGFGAQPSGRLADWLAAVNLRESVSACREAAAAVASGSEAISLEAVREALDKGLFKREYRDHRLEWMIRSGGLQIVSDGLAKANIRFVDTFV